MFKKLGGYTYELEGEVVVRTVTSKGQMAKAGIVKGDIILEVNSEVVYGIEDFYKKIILASGDTSIVYENKEGVFEVNLDLPQSKPEEPSKSDSLEGEWQSGYDSKFTFILESETCDDELEYETYSYKSFYRYGISSYGTLYKSCRDDKLQVESSKFDFTVKGKLESNKYMIWYGVPFGSNKVDFHIWR